MICNRTSPVVSKPRRILPYSLGGGVPLAGFAKVLPFKITRLNFANFVNLYQSKNAQLFLISIFYERSRQVGPYSRPIFYDY